MEEKIATPNICVYPDEATETMNIEVELPGMDKENITFNIYENGFYLVAKKKGKTVKKKVKKVSKKKVQKKKLKKSVKKSKKSSRKSKPSKTKKGLLKRLLRRR